jgi:hypothetical protein
VIVGSCHYCGHPVDDAVQTIARRIVGWEAVRKGTGGANRIVGRTVLDGYVAHVTCCEQVARRRRNGINDDQEALL